MALGISSKKFALDIEELVRTKNMSYMEAVLHICEQKDIEPARIVRFIDKGLKEKIQVDAEELNYLPKSRSLPGL